MPWRSASPLRGSTNAGVAGRDGDGDAGRHERPPAAGGEGGVLPGVEVEAGVAGVGVGRQRQVGVEADDRHGERHRPGSLRSAAVAHRAIDRAASARTRTAAQMSAAATPPAMERPPSVDALARSLAASGLPHPLLVDVARQAIADGAVDDAPARAEAFRRTLLTPVVNATGVLLHTNLGRAPLAHHAGGAGPVASSSTWRPASAARASAAVGQLFARLCGAEAAMVVNNNAAAVLLVLAALAAGRDVPVSRGESVEIGGGVPRARGDGAVRRPARRRRHDEPHPARRLPTRDRPARRRRRARAQGAPEQLPRRRVRRGRRRSPSWRRSGVPVVADIGSGLLDATCPWLAGPHPPAWLAGEPAAVQTLAAGAALVTFSGDKLLGGPQAGHHRRARRPRRALRRATRWPGRCAPAASCSPRCRTSRSPTSRRDVVDAIPFWRMAADAGRRAARTGPRRSPTATGGRGRCATEARARAPDRRRARRSRRPACAVDGDQLAALRAHDPPVIARAPRRRAPCSTCARSTPPTTRCSSPRCGRRVRT